MSSTVIAMQDKKLVVVGLGYVGLPLALLAAERDWDVHGLDVNEEKITAIQNGRAPIKDPKIEAELKKYPLEATNDPAIVANANIIVIAVPTPVNRKHEPDLTPLISAVTSIKPYLKAGQVLIIESTINPGVMDEVVVPLLTVDTSLAVDAETTSNCLYLAHCPERINPGDQHWTTRNIPRVIGGYSETGINLAHAFYTSILDAPVMKMNSVAEAEAVKILENTFRDVNIAFINEMAKSFAKLNIDITHVIAGASTKPFAFMPHYPSSGVGGHCISVDPYYMIERARQVGFDHAFLKLAREINNSMPTYTVDLMQQARADLKLSDATPVALLGLAYKKNIDDIRESPSLIIRQLLEEQSVPLHVFDPYLPQKSTVKSLDEALANQPIIILATDHDEFVQKLTPAACRKVNCQLIIDCKNALDGPAYAAAGIHYYGIGRKYLPA